MECIYVTNTKIKFVHVAFTGYSILYILYSIILITLINMSCLIIYAFLFFSFVFFYFFIPFQIYLICIFWITYSSTK